MIPNIHIRCPSYLHNIININIYVWFTPQIIICIEDDIIPIFSYLFYWRRWNVVTVTSRNLWRRPSYVLTHELTESHTKLGHDLPKNNCDLTATTHTLIQKSYILYGLLVIKLRNFHNIRLFYYVVVKLLMVAGLRRSQLLHLTGQEEYEQDLTKYNLLVPHNVSHSFSSIQSKVFVGSSGFISSIGRILKHT